MDETQSFVELTSSQPPRRIASRGEEEDACGGSQRLGEGVGKASLLDFSGRRCLLLFASFYVPARAAACLPGLPAHMYRAMSREDAIGGPSAVQRRVSVVSRASRVVASLVVRRRLVAIMNLRPFMGISRLPLRLIATLTFCLWQIRHYPFLRLRPSRRSFSYRPGGSLPPGSIVPPAVFLARLTLPLLYFVPTLLCIDLPCVPSLDSVRFSLRARHARPAHRYLRRRPTSSSSPSPLPYDRFSPCT